MPRNPAEGTLDPRLDEGGKALLEEPVPKTTRKSEWGKSEERGRA